MRTNQPVGFRLSSSSAGAATCDDDARYANVRGVTALPVVDLQAPTGHLHSPLRKAAHRLGFCYVAGHGHVRELFARMPQAARRLFALAQVKNDPDVASRYGYVPRYRAG